MAAESYARGATEPALIEQTIGDFFDAMVARQPDALALARLRGLAAAPWFSEPAVPRPLA